MGMDVYGKNPKINSDDFPVYCKLQKMDFKKRWDILDKKAVCEECQGEDCGMFVNENGDCWKCEGKGEYSINYKLKKLYHKEWDEYESSNPGVYFRNNVWWWRPLWDYCYFIADDLISEELWNNGHNNSGAGLNDKDAKLLGNRLLQKIREGDADMFKKLHEEQEEDKEYKYPFDVDNVKAFAEFCIQSGGFEIC